MNEFHNKNEAFIPNKQLETPKTFAFESLPVQHTKTPEQDILTFEEIAKIKAHNELGCSTN